MRTVGTAQTRLCPPYKSTVFHAGGLDAILRKARAAPSRDRSTDRSTAGRFTFDSAYLL